MSDRLRAIAEATISRYSERYEALGYNVRTLGWGTTEQQRYRFERVVQVTDPSGRSLLDIGCGFGDLKTYCAEIDRAPSRYVGWDINPDLIEEARRRHPRSEIDVVDLSTRDVTAPVAEVGVMLGVLNFNLRDSFSNIEFSKLMIGKAFDSVERTLVVDFLSTHRTPGYPAEDFVFYHDPSEMLTFVLSLTPNVQLIHDYAPIPQKEFLLVLNR